MFLLPWESRVQDVIASTVESKTSMAQFRGRYHLPPACVSDDYVMTETILGSGGSGNGNVLLAHGRPGRRPAGRYAVKTLPLAGIKAARRTNLESEVSTFLCADHPHVAQLYDVYETDECLRLVMECMDGGELLARVQKGGHMVDDISADIIRQMLLALSYLHCRGIVHRDVKLENAMYDQQGSSHVKFIDFGLSTFHDNRSGAMTQKCGTLDYIAPELLRGQYTQQCDMWGLGIVSFIMLTGIMPFNGSEDHKKKSITAGRIPWMEKHWKAHSAPAKQFVKGLLVTDASQRLTAQAALQHPWIARIAKTCSVEPSLVAALMAFPATSQFQRRCFSMVAGILPSEAQAGLREQFTLFDRSGKGTLNLRDLLAALPDQSQNDVCMIFKAVAGLRDPSGKDVEIHYSDFLAAGAATCVDLHDDLLRAAFQRFDKAGSGAITAQGLQSLFGNCFVGGRGSVEMLLDEAAQHGGAVTYPEFSAFLCRSQQKLRSTAALDSSRAGAQDRPDMWSPRGGTPMWDQSAWQDKQRSCYSGECALQ